MRTLAVDGLGCCSRLAWQHMSLFSTTALPEGVQEKKPSSTVLCEYRFTKLLDWPLQSWKTAELRME